MSRHTVASVRAGAVLLLLSAMLLCSPLLAATINVPGTYSTIQAAINAAGESGEVVVAPGTYHEHLDFSGKEVTVRSTDPLNPSVVATTIIDGGEIGSAVMFYQGESSRSVLSGFTLTNGLGTLDSGSRVGGGIYIAYSSPTITNNIITGNVDSEFGGGIFIHGGSPTIQGNVIRGNSVHYSGGGIYSWYATPLITNNVVSGNIAEYYGGGIDCTRGGGTVIGNTISGNAADQHYGGGLLLDQTTVTARNNIISFATKGGGVYITSGTTVDFKYCDVYGNNEGNYTVVADQTGSNGNLSVDPLFANAASGDFHLKAIAGRWNGAAWVNDAVSSPCLDAGDPSSPYANEPAPNGGCVNMGAFGNTIYASKSGTVVAGFSISGHVRDSGGNSVANVQMAAGTWTATTDANGAYTVSGLAAGKYTVTPTLTGYGFAPASLEVTVGPNATGKDFVATAGGTPPKVIANLPTGAKVNPERPALTVAFNTAMDKNSAQEALRITPASGEAAGVGWPGTFTWTGNQMRYKLSTSLAPGTRYTVKMGTGARSAVGVPMAEEKSWTFTTSRVPAVLTYAPTGNTVPRTTAKVIRITFNQPMNKTSAQNALWLYKTGTTPVTQRPDGYFGWSGNEMRLNLKRKLDPLTSYTVKLTKTAKSKGGVARTSDFTWTFKTGAAATAPAVVTVAAVPAVGGAQLTLTLATDAEVAVVVINLAGREVAALSPGTVAAGTQTLRWNGRSATGRKLPAGHYLIQVRAQGVDGTTARALCSLTL